MISSDKTRHEKEQLMRLPNFLGLGGQKCGTTWLHHYLDAHPLAFVPSHKKELCYFDVHCKNQGLEEYSANFADAGDEVAVGEITPTYLWTSPEHAQWGPPNGFRHQIPERVKEMLGGELKLIVLLRNPIHRTISAFLHNIKMGRIEPDAPLRPWLAELGIVHMGLWGAHLARWAEAYDQKNFFIVAYEDLFANPQTLKELDQFLSIAAAPNLGWKKDARYQSSFDYVREGDVFRLAEGRVIASAEDTAALRDIFRADVARLKTDWNISGALWAGDFP